MSGSTERHQANDGPQMGGGREPATGVLVDVIVWQSPALFSNRNVARSDAVMPLRQSQNDLSPREGFRFFAGIHSINTYAQIRNLYLYIPADVTNRTLI
jgi:hypothetical protein